MRSAAFSERVGGRLPEGAPAQPHGFDPKAAAVAARQARRGEGGGGKESEWWAAAAEQIDGERRRKVARRVPAGRGGGGGWDVYEAPAVRQAKRECERDSGRQEQPRQATTRGRGRTMYRPSSDGSEAVGAEDEEQCEGVRQESPPPL